MTNFLKQLLVEKILSGSKPYIAFHPESGVPVGIFNTKDEPNKKARLESIKLYGKQGNPISYLIAKLLGIKNPLPSYITLQDANGNPVTMSDLFADSDFQRELRRAGYSKDTGPQATTTNFQALETLAKERIPKDRITTGELERMVSLTKDLLKPNINIADKTKLIAANMDTILDILALEDTLRHDISKSIGMSNEQLLDTVEMITEASLETAEFNVGANELFQTFKGITNEVGRNLTIQPSVLQKASVLTKTLEGFDAGAFGDAFDRIGMNLTDAMGEIDDTNNTMQDITDTGRQFGVVMKDFLGNVSGELKMINTFGFQDGVEGLSRMVARGQVLGLEMGKVRSMALDFLEPEKAIDFAAQMQVIGGAVGDLTDPFKLMYMATNDMEGLQTAILDTAEAAVHFDKEKGKFSISPDQRRQLKAQAELMGMDYQELADTAIKAAKRASISDQFMFDATDADKDLIASMAEITKGGVAEVRIPSLDEMVAVEDLTEKQLEELRREGMTDSETYKQQLTVAEKANQYLASMDSILRLQLAEQMKDVNVDNVIERETLTQQVAGLMPDITQEDMQTLRGGDMAEITSLLADKLPDQDDFEKFTKMFSNVLNVQDFILTDNGVIQFQEDDLLIGGTKLGETLANLGMGGAAGPDTSSLDIISNMAAQTPPGMSGGRGMVELTGTIKLEGGGTASDVDVKRFIQKLSDNSNNVQALNNVIMRASNT